MFQKQTSLSNKNLNKIFNPQDAAEWLNHGKILIHPTEGVWGIGCDAFNQSAVENWVKKWIYFTLEKKALGRYFGMRKDGIYFKDLLSI